MKTIFRPKGVCSQEMEIDTEDGVITNLVITGGCPGNLLGLSKLVTGMKINDAISQLEGLPCGNKTTSCPDQLAKALKGIKG